MFKSVPTPTALTSVEADLHYRDNRHYAHYRNLTLSSAFQPIFSFAHGRAVGYEALLRAQDAAARPVSPLEVFALPGDDAELVHLDRLCRSLHLRNHQSNKTSDAWLFLNINPRVVVEGKRYGAFFTGLLEHLGIAGHRLVIEILEGSITDEAALAESLAYYRDLGCLIAIDDFGAGHSNFERIWRLSPDIVKLDRSMIVQAVQQTRVRRILPGLVALLHEAGCLVTMEGVETEDEALIAMDADTDLVQGYYFARPSTGPQSATPELPALPALGQRFREISAQEATRMREDLDAYLDAFLDSAFALRTAWQHEEACAALLKLPRVERCYVLDPEGMQIGTNLVPQQRLHQADPRFDPLVDTRSATWFRRPYFRRAMENPGELQITRPYLSLTGARMCITLSMAIKTPATTCILCCDLECCSSGVTASVLGS
jgi:EAL domain-containing protein (putative c-di-GMP-specific phosphodiesterase class I)